MKTIIFENLSRSADDLQPTASAISSGLTLPNWYFVADSALINSGKPFFIPEFSDEFEAFLAPIVRIQRLGKTIEGKFAQRYYSEIAPGIHIWASKLREELKRLGLPLDPSHNFDRSLTVGEFLPISSFSKGDTLTFHNNGEKIAEWKAESAIPSANPNLIDDTIEKVSRTNTLKMGDLLIPELCGPTEIKIGDRLSVALNDKEILFLQIK